MLRQFYIIYCRNINFEIESFEIVVRLVIAYFNMQVIIYSLKTCIGINVKIYEQVIDQERQQKFTLQCFEQLLSTQFSSKMDDFHQFANPVTLLILLTFPLRFCYIFLLELQTPRLQEMVTNKLCKWNIFYMQLVLRQIVNIINRSNIQLCFQ